MNTYNEIHTPAFSDFEFLRPSAVSYLPHSMECGSRWETYGSSSGWTSDLTRSAGGEYFERKHFYLDVPVHATGTLSSTLNPEETTAFVNALVQTSSHLPSEEIYSHAFDLTNAYRISDFIPCKIPTACVSISPCRNPIDNQIYPMRDTCGCSAHTHLESAILGALKEALERQFLLRFWLTSKHATITEYNSACQILSKSKALPLLQKLHDSGKLCMIDISDPRFPGTCLLVCYGNPYDSAAKVKYCAGMAYTSNFCMALEKSIIELWQTFRFMLSLGATYPNQIKDPYLKHFIECNHYKTYETITTNLLPPSTASISSENEQLTARTLIDDIRATKLDGFLYLASMPTKQSTLYFCKYVSPNTFLHMNNSFALNTDNLYSGHFSRDIIPTRLATMVPFP